VIWLRLVRALVVGACVVGTLAPVSAASGESTANPSVAGDERPTLTGPVTGGIGRPTLISTSFDLADVGYVGEEYFISGTATAYSADEPLDADGKWRVEPASTAPYTTRIVVRRPADPDDFDGTVFVEWLNVSPGFDNAPDWGSGHNAIIRAGAAWVGVSAQSIGVQGGAEAVAGLPSGLIAADPERYGSLSHPGDSYSYDLFTQVGRALRHPGPLDPLAGLGVERVIAIGESQGAFRLVTYINAVQPEAGVYDGFLVHSRAGGGVGLSQAPLPDIEVPDRTVIRADSDVPVLTFQTETDLTVFGSLRVRQRDTKRFRLWEVAGTAHADGYTAGIGFGDTGDGQAEVALLDVANATGGPLGCDVPINLGPAYLVLNAALTHLERWVRDGTAPPRAPRLEVAEGEPLALERDEHGNALGGIRTALVDVPTATLSGESNDGGTFCFVFGSTTALDAATLGALYESHDAYVKKFNRATDRAVKAGFLLPVDAKNLKAAAARSKVGEDAG
jgi:hypothetical protein